MYAFVCRVSNTNFFFLHKIQNAFSLQLKWRCYGRWSIGAMVGACILVLGYVRTCDRNNIWQLTWLRITNGFVNMLCSRSHFRFIEIIVLRTKSRMHEWCNCEKNNYSIMINAWEALEFSTIGFIVDSRLVFDGLTYFR